MSLFALFDVESRIDKSLIRQVLYPELPDTPEGHEQAYQFLKDTLAARQNDSNPFFPLQWHVPISISVARVDSADWQLGTVETILATDQLPSTSSDYEREIVEQFWNRAERFREKFKGCFVGFNSRGFDFPLLELHALKYGCPTPFILGERYGIRYRFQSDCHLDLMEFITNYGADWPAKGGLGFYLQFLGYAGKGKTSGGDVQALYEAGRLAEVQAYNRRDVRLTYVLFLHVQVMRGMLPHAQAVDLIKTINLDSE